MVSHLDQIYYRRELTYLREQGKRFSERHPEIARYLGIAAVDPGLRDPHAERIIEGFAFLLGRFTRFQEAQYPQFIQSLFQMIHPQYLQPLPCKTLAQFSAMESMIDKPLTIPEGSECYAAGLGPQGERYTFTTCWDLVIQPLNLERVYFDPEAPGDYNISLVLRAHEGCSLADVDWERLEFTICGEPTFCAEVFLLLKEYRVQLGIKGSTLPQATLDLDFRGFQSDHEYGHNPANRPSRLQFLRDYFDDPRRFLFFHVKGLSEVVASQNEASTMQLDITFSKPFTPGFHIDEENIRLHCVPAQNRFEIDCEPFQADGEGLEYSLSPDAAREDLEVCFVKQVVASRDRDVHQVQPYYHFNRGTINDARQFFYALRRDTAAESGWDTYLRFLDMEHQGPGALAGYTLSVRVACSNRHFAQKLKMGQLNKVSSDIPEVVKVTNISLATRAAWPPLHSREEWDFLAHLGLDYSELEHRDTVHTLLKLYCTARDDGGMRRIAGITAAGGDHDYIIKRGTCIPGRRLELDVNGNHFNGLGDLAMFTQAFGHFLQAYCPINGFVRLVVNETETQTRFEHVAWG